jgi:DNA-binding transcriptional ArsR family regulator
MASDPAREALSALGALAHEHRLAIYRLLVKHGTEGLPAGAIAGQLGLAPSSLTFHLQHLTRSGLLRQRRVSRQIFYATNFVAMSSLIGYLTEECCTAGGASCDPICAAPSLPADPRVRIRGRA